LRPAVVAPKLGDEIKRSIGGDEPLIAFEVLAAFALTVFGSWVGWKFSRKQFGRNQWIRSNPDIARWRDVMCMVANLPLLLAAFYIFIMLITMSTAWIWH
jgi:hypothetical protein